MAQNAQIFSFSGDIYRLQATFSRPLTRPIGLGRAECHDALKQWGFAALIPPESKKKRKLLLTSINFD